MHLESSAYISQNSWVRSRPLDTADFFFEGLSLFVFVKD